MSRSWSFYDLRDALAQPDCAICRMTAETADGYLESLLWESVNDPEVRFDIRQARGFCHVHSWRLARHRESLGATIIMNDVLRDVLRVLEDAHFQSLPILSLRRTREALDPKQPTEATADVVARLIPQKPCPACVETATMEKIFLGTLIENLLGEDGLLTAFQSSDGLCLPHFRQTLTQVRDRAVFEALLEAQRTIWEGLADQLSEIIRKADYRFQGEAPGEESGSSLRAITALAGAQRDRAK
jgi:hypothetical protein